MVVAQTFTTDEGEITIESMSTDAQILNGAGGTTILKFKAKGKWILESDCDWMSVSPACGKSGKNTVIITTNSNLTGHDRTGQIIIDGNENQTLTVCQRPYIFERKQVASGTVTNEVTLTYTDTQWNWIYPVLPYPKSNIYQDIESVNTYSYTVYDCPDGINSYIATNYNIMYLPLSGATVLKEDINATVYEVTAKLDMIDNIPPYDPNSDVCKKYLGKEKSNIIDPTHKTIKAVADTFWTETKGDIISYALKCYEWTATNINYGKKNMGMFSIAELIKTKEGDCGNYASVFISLLRAKGIPARHIAMINPNSSSYHVTSEFYIPAYGWIPADPTYKNANPKGNYFGKFTGDKYLVMSFGVNLTINGPMGNDITDLLQDYSCWYSWTTEGNFKFNHVFSKFR